MMDSWKILEAQMTREQRVDLITAMLIKSQKVTWQGVQYRIKDAIELHISSVAIVALLIAILLVTNPSMVSIALDLMGVISYIAISLYGIMLLRRSYPEFGLSSLLVGLLVVAVSLTLVMLLLVQFPILIALVGIFSISLILSVSLQLLAHLIQVSLVDITSRPS